MALLVIITVMLVQIYGGRTQRQKKSKLLCFCDDGLVTGIIRCGVITMQFAQFAVMHTITNSMMLVNVLIAFVAAPNWSDLVETRHFVLYGELQVW